MKKILMIVGSLRENSFNQQLAEEITSLIGSRAEVSHLTYDDLPYMNQDREFPAPESVARVRAQVQEADGLWICTPEYNGSVPGGLKNLLDWLSRPLIKNDPNRISAARGKKITISGAAGKSGASGVRGELEGLLHRMAMQVIAGNGTGVVLNAEAFSSGKAVFSDEVRELLKKQVDVFLAAVEQ